MLLRIVIYWLVSACGAGVIAGVARFPTYAGNVGSFAERFALYAIPFPMALGMFHLPALLVGTLLCLTFSRPVGRYVVRALGALLVLAALAHALAHLADYREHWYVFAYATLDLVIVFIIGLTATRFAGRSATEPPEST